MSFKTYLTNLRESGYTSSDRITLEKALSDALKKGEITQKEYTAILAEYDNAQAQYTTSDTKDEPVIFTLATATYTTPTLVKDPVVTDVGGGEISSQSGTTTVVETNPSVIVINELQANNWEGMGSTDIMRLLKDALERGYITNTEYLNYLNDFRGSTLIEPPVEEPKVLEDGSAPAGGIIIEGNPDPDATPELPVGEDSTSVNYAYNTIIRYEGELTPPPPGSPMTSFFIILEGWLENGWYGATPGGVYDVLNRLVALQVITVQQYAGLIENFQTNFANNMAGVSIMLNQILVDAMNHGMQNMTRLELSNKLDELIRYKVIDENNANAILDAWDKVNEWANGTLGKTNWNLAVIGALSAIFSYTIYNYPKLLPAIAEMAQSLFWIIVYGLAGGLVAFTAYKIYSNYKGSLGSAIAQTVKDMIGIIKDFIIEIFTELFPMLLSMFGSIAGDSLLDNVAGVIDTAIAIGNTISDEITYEEYTKQIITACYLYMENFPVPPTISEVNSSVNQTLALQDENESDTPAGDFFDTYL